MYLQYYQVIGMHFVCTLQCLLIIYSSPSSLSIPFLIIMQMNPVPVMQLVEIIPSLATSDATLNATLALAKSMGKTTTQSKDMPGFIANRLLMPYINEACQVFILKN